MSWKEGRLYPAGLLITLLYLTQGVTLDRNHGLVAPEENASFKK